ncbi:XTP/dITP diphosphatase [Cohnella faecalis]|uniref:XTP/dITP diphosphatase n=1 Tax=Cohnella faecalis TaxID=2315694 RepID=UPI001F3F457D|nr:XTP/dITP diphosphatase [Cohnella faecalis]
MIRAGGTVLIATKNRGKTKEFRKAFEPIGVTVTDLNETDGIPPIEETGVTFAENAMLKAREVARLTGIPVLADDSGLCVDALGGAPGVYSARYAGEGAGDKANNAKLLSELGAGTAQTDAEPSGEPRTLSAARFVCSLALYDPATDTAVTSEGTVEGLILAEPRGEAGFGYDPLFWVPGFGRSMAELTPEEKNAISHRGNALKLLLEKL